MTFGDFSLCWVGLIVVYYVIVIAADYYKLKNLADDSLTDDQEIDISGAVEQYEAVDAAALLDAVNVSGFVNPSDKPDDDDNEARDININFQEGIEACNLAAMFASHSGEASLFEGVNLE